MKMIVAKAVIEKLLYEMKFFNSCKQELDSNKIACEIKVPCNKQNYRLIAAFEISEEDTMDITIIHKTQKIKAELTYYTKYVKFKPFKKPEFYYKLVIYVKI